MRLRSRPRSSANLPESLRWQCARRVCRCLRRLKWSVRILARLRKSTWIGLMSARFESAPSKLSSFVSYANTDTVLRLDGVGLFEGDDEFLCGERYGSTFQCCVFEEPALVVARIQFQCEELSRPDWYANCSVLQPVALIVKFQKTFLDDWRTMPAFIIL